MKLEDLDLNVQLLIAGFAGGVVHAFAVRDANPLASVGSVVMGALTANYLTPLISSVPYVGDKLQPGGCGFVVGISAMAIVQGVIIMVQNWIDRAKVGGRDSGVS